MRRAFMLIIAGMVVAGLIMYHGYVVPERESAVYITNVRSASRALRPYYQELSRSVYSDAFEPVDMNPVVRNEKSSDIQRSIDNAEEKLRTFDRASKGFIVRPYAVLSPSYRQAKVLSDHSQAFIAQSTTLLGRYRQTTLETTNYLNATHELNQPINEFNQVSDINSYAGRSGEVRDVSASIRRQVDELRLLPLASELSDTKEAAAISYVQAAEGFDELAFALEIAVDDAIYAAVAAIETAGRAAEEASGGGFEEHFRSVRTIRDVTDLENMLEAVSF